MKKKTPIKHKENYWRMRFVSLYLRKNSEYRETIPATTTLDEKHPSHLDTTTMPTVVVAR